MGDHTPAPWTVCKPHNAEGTIQIEQAHQMIGEVYGDGDDSVEETAANANLVAAAPEMLAALHAVNRWAQDWHEDLRHLIDAAIAKATGGQS